MVHITVLYYYYTLKYFMRRNVLNTLFFCLVPAADFCVRYIYKHHRRHLRLFSSVTNRNDHYKKWEKTRYKNQSITMLKSCLIIKLQSVIKLISCDWSFASIKIAHRLLICCCYDRDRLGYVHVFLATIFRAYARTRAARRVQQLNHLLKSSVVGAEVCSN